MSMADRDGAIWHDGKLVPWREANFHFLSHTLHYGLGVFEGVRAYETASRGTCIFRLADHTRRLLDSAHILSIDVDWTQAELEQAQCEVVRANGLSESYLRPMCMLGVPETPDGMGLRAEGVPCHTVIAAWEWPRYMDGEANERGIRVHTSSFTRHHVNAAMCRAKGNGYYINSILALREARSNGFDEALLLDPEGFVAEGSGENLFIVRGAVLHTPSPTFCLDGITRDTVIQLAREEGIEVRERRISRDEVYIADEAFLTGTAAEVVPVRELDRRRIGNGDAGEMTKHLQALYLQQVRGQRSSHPEWLVPVAD